MRKQLVSHVHPCLIELSNFAVQCSVVVGKLSHVSLPNAGVVARPSTVERIVRVRLGAKDIDFGAAPRTLTTTATITITTGSEGLVPG